MTMELMNNLIIQFGLNLEQGCVIWRLFENRNFCTLKATGDAVDMIREAQKRGVRVTAETCHHYLNLSAKEVPQGQTQFKCCPPIRGVPTEM